MERSANRSRARLARHTPPCGVPQRPARDAGCFGLRKFSRSDALPLSGLVLHAEIAGRPAQRKPADPATRGRRRTRRDVPRRLLSATRRAVGRHGRRLLRTGTHGQRSLELHSRLPSAAPLRPGRFGGRRPFDRRVRLSRRVRAPRRADQLRDRHRLPRPPRIPTGRSPSPQHRQRSDGHDRRRILDGSIPHRPDCARTHLQTVAGGRILRRTGRQYRRIPHDGTGQLFRTLRRRRRPVPLLQRQGIRAFADSSPEPHLRLVGPPAIRAFLQPQHFQRTQLRPGRPTRDANPVGQRRTPLRAGRFRSGGLLRIEAGIRKRRRQRRDGGLPDIGRVSQCTATARCDSLPGGW